MHDRPDKASRPDLPLAGVRIVEVVTGPMRLAARLLADLGADVVTVEPTLIRSTEPPHRVADGIDLDAARLDRGKSTVRPNDVAELRALLDGADALIENVSFRGDDTLLGKLSELQGEFERLAVVSVSDFGRTKGFETWQATEPVLHALSGGLARSGLPGREPLLPPAELATACAATQAAFLTVLAILEALTAGVGTALDFSVLDGAVQTLDPGFGISGSATAGALGVESAWGRPDVRHRYPVFQCADGHVRICLLAPRQWRGMFAWMGSPAEFADPSYAAISTRFASPTLLPAIGRLFAGLTVADIEREGQRHGVPVAGLLSPTAAIRSEQTAAAGAAACLAETAHESILLPKCPILIDGQRADGSGSVHGALSPVAAFDADVDVPTVDADGGRRPLAGLRVLDLGVIVVGAETGRLLADAGADVVKIENPAFPDGVRQTRDGSGMSESFAAGQRNKRSLALDLRDPRGKELFLDLVGRSDVVLSNFKPGTLDALGLKTDVLLAANPRLICVDSSAFGPIGPASARLGYGPLVRASSGITELWTYEGDPESFSDATTVYPDHAAGRLGALCALALLVRRRRTGHGGSASVVQAEIILDHLATEVAVAQFVEAATPVSGMEHDAPWGVFPCAGDDAWCAVTVRGDSDWRRLAPLLNLNGDRALDRREGRIARRSEIEDALLHWLAARSDMTAMEQLQAAGVPAGAMLRVRQLPDFAYFQERDFYRPILHPSLSKEIYVEARPVHSAGWMDPKLRPAPLMGEQSAEILAEWLSLAPEVIEERITEGIVGPLPVKKEIANAPA